MQIHVGVSQKATKQYNQFHMARIKEQRLSNQIAASDLAREQRIAQIRGSLSPMKQD
jgi:hypothetical protein